MSTRNRLTIGQLVSMKIPDEDRSGVCPVNRIAKILAIDEAGYLELQTEVCVINEKIHSAEVNPWSGYEPDNLRTAPVAKVSLVTSYRAVTSYGSAELKHCNCVAKDNVCSTNRCPCKKSSVPCSSRCRKCVSKCANRS